MTHEPECLDVRDEYQVPFCVCPIIRAAYRRGFNDHAREMQHWLDGRSGRYRTAPTIPTERKGY